MRNSTRRDFEAQPNQTLAGKQKQCGLGLKCQVSSFFQHQRRRLRPRRQSASECPRSDPAFSNPRLAGQRHANQGDESSNRGGGEKEDILEKTPNAHVKVKEKRAPVLKEKGKDEVEVAEDLPSSTPPVLRGALESGGDPENATHAKMEKCQRALT